MRAGNKIYKGLEIPYNAKIIKDKKGKECYLSGISGNDAILKYIETDKFLTVSYELIKDKLK